MSEPTSNAPAPGEQEQTGYLHRRAPLMEMELRALLAQVFEETKVCAFGASTVELQQISHFPSVAAIQFHGERGVFDFGHVFSPRAEVRWKYDGASYDALVLTEDETLITELGGAQPTADSRFAARQANRETDIVLNTPHDVQQRSMRWRLGYREYRGSNQAVQFLRYTDVREEPNR